MAELTRPAVAEPALGTIDQSREALIGAIGESVDVSLVLCGELVSDQLRLAGARTLLDGVPHRELQLDELAGARGETVLLLGPGLTRLDHGAMPWTIVLAELRFERVIILPASVDPSEDSVRDVLSRTRATVFTSDPDSFRDIADLCDARLAHDCSFFFDFTPHGHAGEGVLNAFRAGRTQPTAPQPPPDNDDISVTAPDLGAWLREIAAHELVRTDRPHVMIAAALMGKQVEYATGADPRIDSIATAALGEHRVTPIAVQEEPLRAAALGAATTQTLAQLETIARAAPRPPVSASGTRVTAVLLTRDRPDFVLRALDSMKESESPARAVVIDNNSAPESATALAAACEAREDTDAKRSPRTLGSAGGGRLGTERADTEFVLFLDDDAELMAGALDHLIAELDRHPDVGAVTPTVLRPDGTVFHSGGAMSVTDETATFELYGDTLPLTDADLPPSGRSGWAPGTAVLVRRRLLEEFPIDESMAAYFEDNEWSYRVTRAYPDVLWRSREALVVHHAQAKHKPASDFESRAAMTRLLGSYARFYEKHGLLLCPWLFEHLPELRADDGSLDTAAARLLMELVIAKGGDWTLMSWMNGDLDGLLTANRRLVTLRGLDVERALLKNALAQSRAELAELDSRLRLVEESVTWQLIQRARAMTFGLLGGEGSRAVNLVQRLLRRLGRALFSNRS